jgi:hypothetical protein
MTTSEKLLAFVWLAAALLILPLTVLVTDAELRSAYSNGVQLLAAYLAAILCMRASSAFAPGDATRQVWMLMGLGVLAWALGQSYFWMFRLLTGQETSYPSLADVGFLMIGPLFVIALLRFRFAAGLSAPGWALLLSPLVLLASAALAVYINWEGIRSEDLGLQLASIAYSVSDPLLLAVTLLVASGFGRGSIARAWWYVVYGITCFFFANQAYSTLVFHELYASGSPIDAFWPLAFGLIALGAVRSRAAHATDW